jgi:hypothetical protein
VCGVSSPSRTSIAISVFLMGKLIEQEMPKKAAELSALSVRRLCEPGLHFVGGVAGLALQVTRTGARTWILRVMVAGRRRDMGLGGFPDVELAAAREKARAARSLIEQGIDPIDQRQGVNRKLIEERATQKTFSECARAYIESKSAEWSNAKHAAQWTSTLNTYVAPVIGSMRVRDVGVRDVVQALEPIWRTKMETATRVRARIEAVLAWATVNGYRDGPNPATWRGRLEQVLPKPSKFARIEHHKAVPVKELPSFYERPTKQDGIAARALQFTVLTACRSGEVRGAKWSEIDLTSAEWVVPAERMKAGKEHRVPLSSPVLCIAGMLRTLRRQCHVGPRTCSTLPARARRFSR